MAKSKMDWRRWKNSNNLYIITINFSFKNWKNNLLSKIKLSIDNGQSMKLELKHSGISILSKIHVYLLEKMVRILTL